MSEYKPLHKLILEGLEEGTVLKAEGAESDDYVWTGDVEICIAGTSIPIKWNPFKRNWRVKETPPKKIEFETEVHAIDRYLFVRLPDDSGLEKDTPVRVTVEEKR